MLIFTGLRPAPKAVSMPRSDMASSPAPAIARNVAGLSEFRLTLTRCSPPCLS